VSRAAQSLRARRQELIGRVAAEREDLHIQFRSLQAMFSNLAGGLSAARWLNASPLLLAGGAVLALIAGRGRMLRIFGAGAAMVGLLQRYRSIFRTVGRLLGPATDSQSVRRSR